MKIKELNETNRKRDKGIPSKNFRNLSKLPNVTTLEYGDRDCNILSEKRQILDRWE
jgi:hypothetical protein